ncbi:WD repeat-containing and planar cell polarity effector protein fritz homolog [Rhipicephalus microplus]|uniref:WD repeat-containing and planar cell polarity effector protein fritz homolog n=1 Tax=Rhipicephalus microplus TaxID=6941 RepID=UPI001889224F|nr:WD repeat-containing and planar cell polarity effector protein fritz homolog [Rhipicephalus microplus]
MVSLLCELQFWTMKDDVDVKGSDLGCFKLYDKGDVDTEELYIDAKEAYAKAKGIMWTPSNKRPEKLRECIWEFEDIMNAQKCISARWITPGLLQFFFQSGVCVFVQVDPDSCKLRRVSVDRYLVGKLASEHVTDAILENHSLLISYYEPKMTYACFGKPLIGTDSVRKLSSVDAKLVTFDILGLPGRRLERKLSLNSLKDWVLNWWSVGDGEVWPWMPSTSNRERSNMVVYALNGPNIELLTYGRIDKVPVLVSFSQYQSNKLLIVEEDASRGGSVAVDVCVYELGRGKFERVSMISISLQGRVVTSQWNNAEDKLVLLCDDASLVLYDAVRQTTHFTTTSFVGTKVTWHPSGSVVFFASEEGQLQCFDTALSTIQLRLNDESATAAPTLNVGSYLSNGGSLHRLMWQSSGDAVFRCPTAATFNCAALLFDGGPLAILKLPLGLLTRGQLGPLELVSEYLKHLQIDEAVHLLLSLDWGRVAELTFLCLGKIVNYLLRQPLDSKREVQLETALGSFYGPAQPIPDSVVAEYGVRISHLARRFFHHLLRFDRLEKAFLLAVDLGYWDLFMDLHNVAKKKGENGLVEVALRRANALKPSRALSECDSNDCDSSSELTDDCCSSDDGTRCTPAVAVASCSGAAGFSEPGRLRLPPQGHSAGPRPSGPAAFAASDTGTSGYHWPPPRAVPVTPAAEEDLIDLSDDYECTSEGVRVAVPIIDPLVPQTFASASMQQSVIRPIPRIQPIDPRGAPTGLSSVRSEAYNETSGTPRFEEGHLRAVPLSPPRAPAAAASRASLDGEGSGEELLQGQAIQCIHFGVV